MQDIVYKLVPDLLESKYYSWWNRRSLTNPTHFPDETKREREFYRKRNLPNPKDLPQNQSDVDETADKLNEAHLESDYHRQDEQVNVCLECNSSNLAKLQRRFIRCSSQATITHLKKFVAKKVFDGIDKYREVSGSACIPVP